MVKFGWAVMCGTLYTSSDRGKFSLENIISSLEVRFIEEIQLPTRVREHFHIVSWWCNTSESESADFQILLEGYSPDGEKLAEGVFDASCKPNKFHRHNIPLEEILVAGQGFHYYRISYREKEEEEWQFGADVLYKIILTKVENIED